MENLIGHCLCGETVISVSQLSNNLTVCHCNICRKQNAGPSFLTGEVSTENVEFERTHTITVYPSSEWAERGFCKQCGTLLFYQSRKEKKMYLNSELFDKLINDCVFNEEIFYKDKPAHYHFADQKSRTIEETY